MAVAAAPEVPVVSRRWSAFGLFAAFFLIASEIIAYRISPPDRDMGDLQKILYVHVPSAWMMSLASTALMIYGLLYLWRKRENDDLIAASIAEVGAVFNGLTLVLGMIWGRPTWGVWWTWDARLTSTLVLFLILVGYLALRSFVDDPQRRATWSAAVGILGGVNAYIVYMSVRWWRTLHQLQSSPMTVDSNYVIGLRLNAFAFLFVMLYFIRKRYEAARFTRAAEEAAQVAALRG
jgi:heme exporter protein C